MAELLDATTCSVVQSQSSIAFSAAGEGPEYLWNRFLIVHGKPAYNLGNRCDTCSFLFERLEGANTGIDIGELTAALAEGLKDLPTSVVYKLSQLMPASRYVVALLKVSPQAVQLNGYNDYFATEQVENEGGVDPFWGIPHHPKVPYYRVQSRSVVQTSFDLNGAETFEFIVPMVPETMLQQDYVRRYESVLQAGGAPTAVALSVLDVKGPAFDGVDHWCLAHYVLDGHHKIAAAAHTQSDITLLAFIAVDYGVSSQNQVDLLLNTFAQT